MIDIIEQLFPQPFEIAIIMPLTIISIFSFLYLAGILKTEYKFKTNYTRKLFHILVFTLAGILGLFFGYQGVMFYGGLTGLIMIYVIYLGAGNTLYEGIAREQDRPHRSFYIGVPFLSTAVGGLFNSFIFGPIAIVGYLVAGWGDAVGEPVGVRFGKHKYNVPTLQKVKCQRSIEGSLAVMGISIAAVFIGLWVLGDHSIITMIIAAVTAGVLTAVIEAVSPHGLDNFTTQVGAVGIVFVVLMLV
jgi:phytol kinase